MSSTSTSNEIAHYIRVASVKALIVHTSLLSSVLTACKSTSFPTSNIILLGPSPPKGYLTVDDLIKKGAGLAPAPVATIPKHGIVWCVFSSGTTSLPKAVGITHKNVIAFLLGMKHIGESMTSAYEKSGQKPPIDPSVERPIALAHLPMYHVYGLVQLVVRSFIAPATLIVMPKFDLDLFLTLVPKYKVNHLLLVPTIVHMLVANPKTQQTDFSSVKAAASGAAYLGPDMQMKFTNLLRSRGAQLSEPSPKTGGGITSGFGMSEVVVSGTFAPVAGMPCGPVKLGSVGVLYPSLKARLVDPETGKDAKRGGPGELWLKGPSVMRGYLNNEKANKETFSDDGWLKTGDEFRIDDEGHLFYVDRLKDIFKCRGLQVTPGEINSVIRTNVPYIVDSCVGGVPSPAGAKIGEEPWAWIVLKEEGKRMDPKKVKEEVAEVVKKHLARHKWLREVVILDALPVLASGKKVVRQLRDEAIKSQKESKL
ncbi:acetyl-CoA synthetase-like protein [Atractiella rhizophila]|nr:acetyl-CoA synthetase-like protein [Atractiella rhizophila]